MAKISGASSISHLFNNKLSDEGCHIKKIMIIMKMPVNTCFLVGTVDNNSIIPGITSPHRIKEYEISPGPRTTHTKYDEWFSKFHSDSALVYALCYVTSCFGGLFGTHLPLFFRTLL